MYIQQLYTGCLAQAAYYIESGGEAAIIDPLRDIQAYLEIATARNAKIKYIFETHFHADFVSGHIDIAKRTGAKIVYGPTATANYNIIVGADGQEFSLGNEKLELIYTPGHTKESSCFLAKDANGKPYALFSGDTLFVGDVGRVDLAANETLTKEELANMMYDSVEKLKKLADNIIVYPGHGAGSACGKNIGKETTTTIGEQRKNNYALQPMSRETFVQTMVSGLSTPPKYFFTDAKINRHGYNEDMESLLDNNLKALSVSEFIKEKEAGAIVLDTRIPAEYAKEHIPGSLNIGLNGDFAVWAGTIIDNVPLVLVCAEGRERESVLRLGRVGYDKVKGFLQEGMNAWKEAGQEVKTIHSISAEEFAQTIGKEGYPFDVRNEGEVMQGTVRDAIAIPLGKLEAQLNTLDKNAHYYIYCQGGYRSIIGTSILEKNGFTHLTNVEGGMNAIKKTTAPIEIPEMA